MVSWLHYYKKIILLPLLLIGFFSVAFFSQAATVAVHPQANVSFSGNWNLASSGSDAACVQNNSSTAWACVNDQPANASSGSAVANDGNASYVRSGLSATASDEVIVSFGSGLVSAGNAITNLSVVSYGRQRDCASCADYQLYYRIGSGGAKTFGASHVPPSTSSYSQFTDNFSVSLTPADLDQLQIGARQTVGNGQRIQVTQIYVTATYSAPETVAPAAVSNLAASSPTAISMRLDWTAPGDDDITGTATSYDIRYSTAVITDANWASATQVSGEPAPLVAGSAQSMTVSGLNANTLYYFAIKTSDEIPNVSALSNVPSGTTLPPPAPTFTTPLAANPTSVVSGGQSTLSWASSGADSCSASAVPANAQWTANGGALNGSQTITNITVDTVFTLTCTNAGGSTPSSATVTITPPPNVSGHAWAGSGSNDGTNSNPGIGWLKMSGTAGDGSPYGVLVSSASPGVLSGYAWANPNDSTAGTNNIGWISFNAADVAGCPTAPCAPTLDRTNGHLTGWARALGYQDAQSGGWDGWIRLWRDSDGDGIVNTDTGAAVSDYGVSVSNCAWSGYAWGGGTTIGWIRFGGALYPVTGSGDGCASSADLTAGSISPTSAAANTATAFSATVSNGGIGSTGSGFTNLFQFDDNVDHATIAGTMTDTSPAVAAGGTDVSQVSYTFPASGTWYVRACADNNVSFVGTIAESNESNNCGAWTSVEVALPILTGTFSASPDTIDPGNPSTLTWTSNATSCVGAGFSTGGNATGNTIVTPTQTSPYQITCSRSGYEDLTLATTVTVISITASISAKPSCISGGGSSKISWSVLPVSQIQAGSCALFGPGLSSSPLPVSPDGSPPNGSPQTATVPTTKSTYTIFCTTTGGSEITKSAIVDVRSCWTEF